MTIIYSNVDQQIKLFTKIAFEKIENPCKKIITCEENILQASFRVSKAGENYELHKHREIKRETFGTQEIWICIKGQLNCYVYDLDDSFICEVVLKDGDFGITHAGGHSLSILEDTYWYEIKNGPYFGKEKDKIIIL